MKNRRTQTTFAAFADRRLTFEARAVAREERASLVRRPQMRSKLFGSLLALLFGSGLAFGQGPSPLSSDWSGPYVGVNIGLGVDASSGSDAWTWLTNFPSGSLLGVGGGPLLTVPATSVTTQFQNQFNHSSTGLMGGVQAGYNWQAGSVVLGFEADFSAMDQH